MVKIQYHKWKPIYDIEIKFPVMYEASTIHWNTQKLNNINFNFKITY